MASKIEEDLGVNRLDPLERQKGNADNIHKITEHIMDSTHPRSFQEYLGLSRTLISKPDIL